MREDEIEDLNKVNAGQNVEDVGLTLPPEQPSHEENKEKLVESLHRDGPIPNLRTYQGDVAEFIKNKDQSLATIALKEHEKRRQEKEEARLESMIETPSVAEGDAQYEIQKEESEKKPAFESNRRFSDLPTNFLIYVISICLLVGVVAVGAYLFVFKESQGPVKVSDEKTIISARKTVTFDSAAATKQGLQEAFDSLRSSPEVKNSGITAVVISDASKKAIIPIEDLVKGFELNIPSALARSLGAPYMLGLYSDSFQNFFLIIKVKDYGIAYRDMLEWEKNLVKDFEPILKDDDADQVAYPFKDLIVKNKDTRAAISTAGRLRLIYTFLDKETILLTESETALKSILDAFVAGNTTR
jgi:hypothetical protein